MTVNYPFTPIEPVALSATVPFTYRDGLTLLEVCEELRRNLNVIAESDALQTKAYQTLIANANEAISSALKTVAELTKNYDGQLEEMRALLAKQLEDVNKSLETLAETIARAEAAEEASAALSDSFNAAMETWSAKIEEFQNLVNGFNADLSKRVKLNTLTFNVMDFGAVGDGVTDDTSAIKATISAAGSNAIVFFPGNHKYLITSKLTQPHNQKWVGGGFAFQSLPGNGTGASIISTYDGIAVQSDGAIENLEIVGPGALSKTNSVGLFSDGSSLVWRDVNVAGFGTGISIANVWYATLDRVSAMSNSVGMKVDYCYNVNLHSCRFQSMREDGTLGTNINMINSSSVRLFGGSLESYRTGISLTAACQVMMFGTYFETREPDSQTGVVAGVLANGANITVVAHGCEVYVSGTAWIFYNGGASGGNLTASGNKFKGGIAGKTSYGYLWSGGRTAALIVNISGDSWYSVLKDGPIYRPQGYASPGSMIHNGLSASDGSNTGSAGTVNISGVATFSGGIVNAYDGRPSMVGREDMVGLTVFDKRLNKLAIWNGTGWVDANGGAL